jgi:hypothetical protein
MLPSRTRVVATIVAAVVAAGCGNTPQQKPEPPAGVAARQKQPPQGRSALQKAREAFKDIRQFTLTQTSTSDLGVFTTTTEVDCDARYYHQRRTKTLTEKGIAEGTTQIQGRPRAESESEALFVQGQSLRRNSSSWEKAPPGDDDATPEWAPSLIFDFDPANDCRSFAAGEFAGLPFGKMLNPSKVTFREERTVGGYACHEFALTYLDQVLSDTMRQVGDRTSVRDEITKPVEGTLCIAVEDSLPLHGTSGIRAFEFGYDGFEKLNVRLPPKPR